MSKVASITCRYSGCSWSRRCWRRKMMQDRGCWWAPSLPACFLWVWNNTHQPTTCLFQVISCVVPNFWSPRNHLDKLCSKDIYPFVFTPAGICRWRPLLIPLNSPWNLTVCNVSFIVTQTFALFVCLWFNKNGLWPELCLKNSNSKIQNDPRHTANR